MAVVRHLATSPAVAAITLVGSRVNSMAAPDSDFDLFVYTDGDLGSIRAEVADAHADPAAWWSLHELGFGDCDAWSLTDGQGWLDLMYWPTTWAEEQLRRVLVQHAASMGYSTAFWRSIRDAQPLYERDGWHADLQRRAHQPYPETLRRNIVNLNRPYLHDHPFSFRAQVAKAIARRDAVSLNHRVAAWLASYADIVFAVNRVLHPGEKRLLEHVARECEIVPDGMAASVVRLIELAGQSAPNTLSAMDDLTDSLEAILRREGLGTDRSATAFTSTSRRWDRSLPGTPS
jgi:hypothetical protein